MRLPLEQLAQRLHSERRAERRESEHSLTQAPPLAADIFPGAEGERERKREKGCDSEDKAAVKKRKEGKRKSAARNASTWNAFWN